MLQMFKRTVGPVWEQHINITYAVHKSKSISFGSNASTVFYQVRSSTELILYMCVVLSCKRSTDTLETLTVQT